MGESSGELSPNVEQKSGLELKGLEQTSTRGNGVVEVGEQFSKREVDLRNVVSHLRIHQNGEVAGSQFNGALFHSPEDIVDTIAGLLPDQLSYDQHGRTELTLQLEDPQRRSVGWSGVKSLVDIQREYPEVQIQRRVRMPGGEETPDGTGAWYPEIGENPETGAWEVVKNPDGSIKNPHGKFEPAANIALVPAEQFERTARTDKVTVIVQKDQDGKPRVLTMFPGENAPAFPAKIQSEDYNRDTTNPDSLESKFWATHAFIQPVGES